MRRGTPRDKAAAVQRAGPGMADPANIGMTAIKPVGWDRTGCEAVK
jgi:hypothetical protein